MSSFFERSWGRKEKKKERKKRKTEVRKPVRKPDFTELIDILILILLNRS